MNPRAPDEAPLLPQLEPSTIGDGNRWFGKRTPNEFPPESVDSRLAIRVVKHRLLSSQSLGLYYLRQIQPRFSSPTQNDITHPPTERITKFGQNMDIALETGRENQRLIFEDVRRHGDSVECTLVIDSKGFMARRRFLFSQLEDTIRQLEQMNVELKGNIRLQEPYQDDLIDLECDIWGHIRLTGQLVEHAEISQSLEFGFVTDQTCLEPLIRALKKIPT